MPEFAGEDITSELARLVTDLDALAELADRMRQEQQDDTTPVGRPTAPVVLGRIFPSGIVCNLWTSSSRLPTIGGFAWSGSRT